MPDAKWSFWKDEAQLVWHRPGWKPKVLVGLLSGLVILLIGGGAVGLAVGPTELQVWFVTAIVGPLVLVPLLAAIEMFYKGANAGTVLKEALGKRESPRSEDRDEKEKESKREISRMRGLAQSFLDTHRHRRT
jgi:hypothetical protein